MSETAETPNISQHQIRAELEAMVLGDLLGPAGGESEELTERTVRDRYLVVVLAPSRSAAAKSAVDEEEDEATGDVVVAGGGQQIKGKLESRRVARCLWLEHPLTH